MDTCSLLFGRKMSRGGSHVVSKKVLPAKSILVVLTLAQVRDFALKESNNITSVCRINKTRDRLQC